MATNIRRRKSLIDITTIMSELQAEEKLMDIFADHVGAENAISEFSLFQKFFNIPDMDKVSDYQFYFYSDIIKKFLKQLRHKGNLLVLSQYRNYYVLSNEAELEVYKNQIDKQIENLEKAYIKAQVWVTDEKFLLVKKKKKKELEELEVLA